jgi:hypothetical protein
VRVISGRCNLPSSPISDLIGSIYDCALDPSRWERTLADVMHSLDCHMLALALADLRHHRFLLNKTVGIEPHQMEQLSKHLPEINATLGKALASLPLLDEPLVISRYYTPVDIETSPHFQEFVKPNGMVDIMQLFLMHTPMHHAGLGVCRHERQGIITEREILA